MRIEYTLTPDTRLISRIAMVSMPGTFGTLLAIPCMFVVLLAVGLVSLLAETGAWWHALGVSMLIVGGTFVVVFPAVLRLRLARLRNSFRQAHVVIDDNGIRSTSEVASNEIRWAAVRRVKEHDEFWILYGDTGVPLRIVPRAALTPEQRSEFAAFLADNRFGAPR